MFKYISLLLSRKNLFTLFILFCVAVFAAGGCNNNGGNNGGNTGDTEAIDPNPDTSQCVASSTPCTTVSKQTVNGVTYGECILDVTNCVADLNSVLNQLNTNGVKVSASSIFWIDAWGANGGGAMENGGKGSTGGYAQFTSTVSDIDTMYNGVRTIYYFLGGVGGEGNSRCGGGGAAGTIVTLEDVTLNPTVSPDENLVLMIAGGGAGAAGGTQKGCLNTSGLSGGDGGVAIAGTGSDVGGKGVGCSSPFQDSCNSVQGQSCGGSGGCGGNIAEGGGGSGDSGGVRQCCINKQTRPSNGVPGYGGLGGKGGSGHKCSNGGSAGIFANASISFSAGRGGNGGGGDNDCTSGGGGGGGGYGGGGGGGLGNEGAAVAGGGGGSFSVMSTKSASIAPSSRPGNPCGAEGCVVISIIED